MRQPIRSRKFRLLGCAICRLYWDRVKDVRSRLAVETTERFVDREVKRKELQAAHAEAVKVRGAQGRTLAAVAAGVSQSRPTLYNAAPERVECQLLVELVGNPHRKFKVKPYWLTWHDATIPKLAQAAYDERELPSGHLDAKRLAILADALEEAGCTNEDVLSHLRGAGPHVRGCWVVDLLLGRE